MPKQCSPLGPTVADDLDAHLVEFLMTLARTRYAGKTQHDKDRLIAPFIRWVRESGIAVADVNESKVEAFLACPMRRRYGQRSALRQFVEHLRHAGAVPPPASEPSPAELLVSSYVEHLRDRQGLSPYSIAVYAPFARAFVAAQGLPQKAAALGAEAVSRHQLDHSRNRSSSFVRLLAATLRSFLRFCFLNGTTAADLSTAVQPVRRWQLAAIPRFLTGEEVEQVVAAASTDRCTACGVRDFAILLLLARLGLRASEILTLEFDDIRWEVGEIVVRSKGGLRDHLPLPHDVGRAIAVYLRTARGSSRSRRLFLRHIAPHVGLSQPSMVSKVAREALHRAGLLPAGRVGGHIFRHSLATRMLQRGASLPEISQVLRHRSTTTTQLYAKVQFEALRAVALPWPTVEVLR